MPTVQLQQLFHCPCYCPLTPSPPPLQFTQDGGHGGSAHLNNSHFSANALLSQQGQANHQRHNYQRPDAMFSCAHFTGAVTITVSYTATAPSPLPSIVVFAPQFTSKMEGMVTDLALAREKQQTFEEWKQNSNKQLPIDISVTVLTTGACVHIGVCDESSPQGGVLVSLLASHHACCCQGLTVMIAQLQRLGLCVYTGMSFQALKGLRGEQTFEEWKQNSNKQLPIDISVTVLTTGACVTLYCLGCEFPRSDCVACCHGCDSMLRL